MSDIYTEAFSLGIRPDPNLTISEWADKYRVLPRESSNEYGKYRVSRTPYIKEIADCLSPQSPVKTVTVCKPTQIGATDGIGNNWLLYIAHYHPGPAMMMLPTVELAKRHSKTKIAPSLRVMDCMTGRVRDVKDRGGGNTILVKEFPGGSWSFVGSNSSGALRSVSVRDLILDDMDGYEVTVGDEGNPADLAKKRQDAFSAIAKVLQISTPTLKETSNIIREYEHSDQSEFQVPCPYCGERQTLEWGGLRAKFGIKWVTDPDTGEHHPETAKYMCKYCHELIPEHYKTQMLANGKWVPKYPERSHKHRGFKISSLYSPLGWVSWEMIVSEFLEAKDTPTKLQVWTNTRLALPWEAKGTRPEWALLSNRAEPYRVLSVPASGLFLTAGVDVQADRFAIKIKAWGRGEESWLIYWGELFGDTESTRVWDELDEFLAREFPHISGISLRIVCAAIDSGYRTHDVYNFARTRSPQIIATKGSSKANHPIIGRPTQQDVNYMGNTIKNGVQLWPVGTNTAKELIYTRLKITTPGPRMMHFPIGLDDDYYQQLTAEKFDTRYTKDGFPEKRWVLPSGSRNEALDVEVLALAAAVRSGLNRMDWTSLEAAINYQASVLQDTTGSFNKPRRQRDMRSSRRVYSNYMSRNMPAY